MLSCEPGLEKKGDAVKLKAQKKSCTAMTDAERAAEGIFP